MPHDCDCDCDFDDIQKKVDQFLESLPCSVHIPYPSTKINAHNKRIAELLLNAYADGGGSELTAITQYLHHDFTIEDKDVSNLELCIALVEMHHLEMLGEMIESLGGDPKYKRTNKYYWTGGYVNYGKTLCEKLSLDILAEQEAIAGYQALLKIIREVDGPGAHQVEKVILRILEDEMLHLKLFKQAFEKHCECRHQKHEHDKHDCNDHDHHDCDHDHDQHKKEHHPCCPCD